MKKFAFGLILGAGLAFTASAHAETIETAVGKVIEGTFSVKVDGRPLQQQAIVVEGTSYLPVREFADVTGYEVTFNPEEQGIKLYRILPKMDISFIETHAYNLAAEIKMLRYVHYYLPDGAKKEEYAKRIEAKKAERDAVLAGLKAHGAELKAEREKQEAKLDALKEEIEAKLEEYRGLTLE
ncbi:hypothetical protein [Paenibacillus turpanensis]|uniref:hypothetical protein n=1 Tax=Paenibacillus turpanensis TaxID=2689078 RepID=UPI00140D9BD7|nr:hypothetical protein [Paenibacillus turpanensis]